jgi:hypothetical protein
VLRFFPTVHTMLEAFRFLYLTEHYHTPSSDDQKKMAALAQITAHRDVIIALTNLREKYSYDESHASQVLEDLKEGYRTRFESFMSTIDDESGASLVMYNDSKMDEERPTMLNMLLEMCLIVTTMVRDFERGLRFQGIEVNRNLARGENIPTS